MATKKDKLKWEKAFNDKHRNYIMKLEEKNFLRAKKMELRQLRKDHRKSIGLTTTKLLSFYLFIVFNIILAYSMIAMWHFEDLTYLNVIISDILGQILVFGIYCIRAYKDTKSEESIKLERDKINAFPPPVKEKLDALLDVLDKTLPSSEVTSEITEESDNEEINDEGAE